ncbi:HlyD family type I secretion periplasmic adaptor subunit [Chromobacterium sp. CV08]|uniref:HlyD family type I secretion periplasmic adaptor subunit n=1 Tax=Chromobacterium sp. CV08 TaxID=3133274 RepID=UPI003DA8526B
MNIDRLLQVLRACVRRFEATTAPEEAYEFLPGYLEILHRPPSPWSRQLARGLALLLVLIIIWSVLGSLDINASATGQIIDSSRSKLVQPLEPAEVVAIHVQDGQHIKKGSPLIDLKLIGASADVQRLNNQVTANRLEVARLKALLTDQPLQAFVPPSSVAQGEVDATRQHLLSEWQAVQSRLRDMDSEIEVTEANYLAVSHDLAELDKLRSNVEARVNSARVLAEKGVVAKVTMLEKTKELLELEQRQEQQRAQHKVLSAQRINLRDRKRSYLTQMRSEYSNKLTQTTNTLAEQEQELAKAKERHGLQQLRAPVDGMVQQLAVHTVGGVVTAAQILLVVVPDAAELEAQVNILNKDIGFITPGQTVEVKVDTFPYSRYGTVPAVVTSVSHDAVKDERQGFVFPAYVRLRRSYILVDGERKPLQAGMSVVSEIKTGTRRVIDYLLSPVREYQATAMRER